MHSRNRLCQAAAPPPATAAGSSRQRRFGRGAAAETWKRARTGTRGTDFFDRIPDDLVLLILSKLSAAAVAPADLISVHLTCRRFNLLGAHPTVLSKVSAKGTAVRAKRWSESTHRFLKRCADAGSLEACYTLGMILFYCLGNRGVGASLMAKAAMGSHAAALYSLAVIQFNGSGGTKSNKDLRAGVALCARAAYFGHVDALRELGHCLQDGYGVRQNVTEGRRLLVQANARELVAVVSAAPADWSSSCSPKATALEAVSLLTMQKGKKQGTFSTRSLLSDFGCNVPAPEAHPANMFMVEWFEERDAHGEDGVTVAGAEGGEGLRMCSHGGCGRPETRLHEFRRCSVCGAVNYCSRACQALHWKLAHKAQCAPMERWNDGDGGVGLAPAGDRGEEVN